VKHKRSPCEKDKAGHVKRRNLQMKGKVKVEIPNSKIDKQFGRGRVGMFCPNRFISLIDLCLRDLILIDL